MEGAAIYLRSSNDKAELGPDIQRKELRAFASREKLRVVAEFSDMEISGSLDETSRPQLKAMMTALRDPQRGWSTILVLDTSRLSRVPAEAAYITGQAEKHRVAIRYAKLPMDGSTPEGGIALGMFRLFDEYHSKLSGAKGRAGLEANIAKGFRAGGRAPFGYKLEHHETGGVRDGKAVTKSKLILDARASK
jgi:DNA invertase Pin-like site-specific DNA recombinase